MFLALVIMVIMASCKKPEALEPDPDPSDTLSNFVTFSLVNVYQPALTSAYNLISDEIQVRVSGVITFNVVSGGSRTFYGEMAKKLSGMEAEISPDISVADVPFTGYYSSYYEPNTNLGPYKITIQENNAVTFTIRVSGL